MTDNNSNLNNIWAVDRNAFIKQFNLKVENLNQPLKDIMAYSLPEWALDGKIANLIVQMEFKS